MFLAQNVAHCLVSVFVHQIQIPPSYGSSVMIGFCWSRKRQSFPSVTQAGDPGRRAEIPAVPVFPLVPLCLPHLCVWTQVPRRGLPFPVPDSNTMPHYHVSEMSKWDRSELGLFSHNCNCLMSVNVDLFFKYERFHLEAYQTIWHWYLFIKKKWNSLI